MALDDSGGGHGERGDGCKWADGKLD